MMNEIRRADSRLKKILPPHKPVPGTAYVPSRFVLSFGSNGKQYAFNSLTRQCLETELPCKCLAGEGYDPLIESYFLVPEGKDESAFYESVARLMRIYSRRDGCAQYTVLPTLACNARCVYCYEEGMKQITMTPEIAARTAAYIKETRRTDKPVVISWFGGEPLLRPDIIDAICEELTREGVEYRSGMITNASLITDKIIDRMQGSWRLNHLQISMDGDEDSYIARKQYYAYHDYYHRVLRSIDKLSARGIGVTIRCNVDPDNWDRVGALIEDMKAVIENKSRVGIYFCPLNHVRASKEGYPLWKKIIDYRPVIEAAGFRSSTAFDLRTDMRVTHCMADAGDVVIGPDGSLYACEFCGDEMRFGDIFNGMTDKSGYDSFCSSFRTREKCRDCPFLPDCTSFSKCPIVDAECREIRMYMALTELKKLIQLDKKERADTPDGVVSEVNC